jgi:hypothetical protein
VRRLPLRFGALLGSVLADNPTLRGTTAHSALSEADEGICFCPLGWSFYHRVSFFTPFLPTHAEVSLSPVVKPSYNGPHQTLVAQLDFAAISWVKLLYSTHPCLPGRRLFLVVIQFSDISLSLPLVTGMLPAVSTATTPSDR